MANNFTVYNGQAQTFAQSLFVTPSAISLVNGSVIYTGDPAAAATFDSLALGAAVIPTQGILLTSGDGTPPNINTAGSYGQSNLGTADSDLANIVLAAFPSAGITQDAAVLEFKINAAAGVKTVVFDVAFGSDEFPEYSNSSYVDIAAILVNGKNAAFFQGDPTKPLSVLDQNLGYFQDNAAGGLPIEYDGLSRKLTVIAPVVTGENTIKIAIADTGDSIFDSGIFVSNVRGSDKNLSGILNEVAGTASKDKLEAQPGISNILIGGLGPDKLLANTGFDILYGDEEEPESGTGTTGKTAEVAALDAISAGTDFKDVFVFKSVKVLTNDINTTDVIADFDKKDKIDLPKGIDFIGKSKFSGDGGEARYKAVKAEDYTAIYIDKNGDKKPDAIIKVLGIHKLNDDDFA